MRVADTSALYAFCVESDGHHKQALAAFRDAEPVVIPTEILAETIELLDYRHGFAVGRKARAALAVLPNLEVQPTWDDPGDDLLGAARTLYEQAEGRLSHCDSIVVAWCRQRKLKPLAFDREIVKAVSA